MSRVDSWDNNLLSIAGRAEFVHTVITPIVLYWLLVHDMPTATLIKIGNVCDDFFWESRKYKIAWRNYIKQN